MKLEEYLRDGLRQDIIDYKIRVRTTKQGEIVFYIHPDSVDGGTLDFYVFGNELRRCENPLPE